jgi:hypothetical protein
LGYIAGINKIMEDEADINYSRKTIIQVSHLKTQIKSLGIRKDEQTLFSLEIKVFYPLATYSLVERAIDFFSSSFGEKEKETIKVYLKMIAFGMGNPLLTFVEKYYSMMANMTLRTRRG